MKLREEAFTLKSTARRVRLFWSGQIKQFYQESKQVTSKSAADFEKEAPKIQKSAQSAADNDNFKLVIARLVKIFLLPKLLMA